jgi:hypothetical protein
VLFLLDICHFGVQYLSKTVWQCLPPGGDAICEYQTIMNELQCRTRPQSIALGDAGDAISGRKSYIGSAYARGALADYRMQKFAATNPAT